MTIVKFPFESAEFPEEGQITTEEVEEFGKLLAIPSKTYSFVSRREWRAAKTKLGRIKRPVNNIVVHYRWGEDKCYDPESCKEFLQDEQRRQIRECGEDDIPFHFLIGDDGTIYEGRGWNYVSSKNLELPVRFQYGYDRFDFAYIGNYEGPKLPKVSVNQLWFW
ncbi:peptidoglycan recognition protein 1-like isoform X2 [Macrosteles quadrilineatus]|uniref:peptidoglycan recognition protein 1-like isoform X2 n=1 Tax=Macrosteles quadrilineatus TaxID=74068 RepID=UPI0023E15D8D|nr:peptidoglycan recognition protein 1-like isoform X2 [Macrosteles quadrilineatus]